MKSGMTGRGCIRLWLHHAGANPPGMGGWRGGERTSGFPAHLGTGMTRGRTRHAWHGTGEISRGRTEVVGITPGYCHYPHRPSVMMVVVRWWVMIA